MDLDQPVYKQNNNLLPNIILVCSTIIHFLAVEANKERQNENRKPQNPDYHFILLVTGNCINFRT